MQHAVRRLAAALLSGVLAGCAAPRATSEGRDLGREADPSVPVATPADGTSRSHLADAVASLPTRLPAEPIAPSRISAGRFVPTSAGGADEAAPAPAQPTDEGGDHEIAKKLSNPIANLISVPFQSNYDTGIGPDRHGSRYQLNVQPVIPIPLNEDWNLISRTIVPIIDQDDVVPDSSQTGVGDITQSLFFSPKRPTESGWIWGAGPVFLVPTAEDDYLGADKWGAGPTAVALRQDSGWTYGMLANHIWSFAGNSHRDEVNTTFLQPFVAYTTHDAWTFSMNSESTYDWLEDDLGVPINGAVAKLVRIGGFPVQFKLGARYWAERTEYGPQGVGLRFEITFLFPTGK